MLAPAYTSKCHFLVRCFSPRLTAHSKVDAFVHTCVSDVVPPCQRSSSRTYIQPFISVLLCERVWPELQQSNNNDRKKSIGKHWLHSEQGRDCFTFSLNLFESALEVTKFFPSATRDPVQTETETNPRTHSEVLSLTFFKSWSVGYFVSGSCFEWKWQMRFWVMSLPLFSGNVLNGCRGKVGGEADEAVPTR